MKRKIYKLLFISTLILQSFTTEAQDLSISLPIIEIKQMDCKKYSNEFLTAYAAHDFLNSMIGDTIEFIKPPTKNKFIPDTVWIKQTTKKPIEGKHYTLKDFPLPDDSHKIWVVEAYSKYQKYSTTLYKNIEYEYFKLKNVESNQQANLMYSTFERVGVEMIDITKSHKISNLLSGQKLFAKDGIHFTERNIKKATMTIGADYVGIHVITYLLMEDNKSYRLPYKTYEKATDSIFTQEYKNQLIEKYKNSGHYNLVLSDVIKPRNPQTKNGKMTKSVSQYTYTDNNINIFWWVWPTHFNFSLENKSGSSIKIEWNEGSFIDLSNSASRIFHSGVKFIDKDKSMPPTIVPNGTTVKDIIQPSDRTSYYADDWHSATLIPYYTVFDAENIGKTVKILLPISINGVLNEYTFVFKVDWVWDHPELRQ